MGDSTSREIERLRAEIAAWRRVHHSRAPLPERLWADAVTLARQLGVNRARTALGVSYGGLRSHVERASTAPAFVELSGAEVLAAAPGATVEITGRDVHVFVRLEGASLDLSSLVAAVRGRA